MKKLVSIGEKSNVDFKSLETKVIDLLSNQECLTVTEIRKKFEDKLNGEQITYIMRYLEFKGILVRTSQRYITDKIIYQLPHYKRWRSKAWYACKYRSAANCTS